jgi:hypothetical protein
MSGRIDRIEASDTAAKPNDPQPEPADSSAPAGEQDIDEGGEFIARQVLDKDATFFGG